MCPNGRRRRFRAIVREENVAFDAIRWYSTGSVVLQHLEIADEVGIVDLGF